MTEETFREHFYRRQRQSVPAAREFTRSALTDWGVTGERAADILLCVSELTTNALVHGVPPGRGFLLRVLPYEDGVRVEVQDSGDGVPAVPRPADETTADAEGGRGLLLVETLADKWGVGERDPGKVVWCELGTARRAHEAMSSRGGESPTHVTATAGGTRDTAVAEGSELQCLQ
ncbi:ATP-binding protein [Streptomyces antnestii]|uniref:ATP-binding protein n=1 Tax=Streptomyces antnestii TaxID=2494256 RepID=A0A437Q1T6_9ACTN|nr:ATP-binding protein [Streptomyces sp. San01]